MLDDREDHGSVTGGGVGGVRCGTETVRRRHPRRCGGGARTLEDVGQFVDGCELSVAKCAERGCRGGILEGVGEVECCMDGGISRRCIGHAEIVREEFDGFGDALGSCLVDVDAVAAVVLGDAT